MVKKETRKDSLLRLISGIGGEGTREQINAKVPVYWELSNEEMEIERGTTKPLYWHRVASVCQALKDRDHYLENPKWGVWKITKKGREYLSSKSYEPSVSSGGPAELLTTEDSALVIKLRSAQRNSVNYTIFEETLTEAFNTLGFYAKHLGKPDEPDISLKILNYKIVVNAKTTNEGVINRGHVDFDAEERNKERYEADYVGIVAPGFSEGNIRVTAERRNVILIETEAICKILQNHAIYPYDPIKIVKILFESDKYIITPKDIPSSTIDYKELIEIVAKILSDIKLTGKTSFSSQELHIAYSWQGLDYEVDKIETALDFLSTAPFSILQKQTEEYSLTNNIEFILKRIGLLLQSFNKMEGKI